MGFDMDLKGRSERLPEYLRPGQTGPGGQRVPSNREIAVHLVIGLVVKAVAIAMVVVGAIHIDDCPREPMVPKYLIGEGRKKMDLNWICTDCAIWKKKDT